MITTTTPATRPCETWLRNSRLRSGPCSKPAAQAVPGRERGTFEAICPFHVKVHNNSRYTSRIEPVAIAGDVLAWFQARDAERARAADEKREREAELARERYAAQTERAWADAGNEWQVRYAPETETSWTKLAEARDRGLRDEAALEAAAYTVPVWRVEPIDPTYYNEPWEVRVEQKAGQPAFVAIRRTGNLTAAGTAALAEALTAAAAVAAGMSAGEAGK